MSRFIILILVLFVCSTVQAQQSLIQRYKGWRTYSDISSKQTTLAENAAKLEIASYAPDFELPNPEGRLVKMSEVQADVIILVFWASWCPSCRKENKEIGSWYADFKKQGGEVVGVSLDESKDDWIEAIKRDNVVWKQASDLKAMESPVIQSYGVQTTPTVFILDGTGKIMDKYLRGEELKHRVFSLLDS